MRLKSLFLIIVTILTLIAILYAISANILLAGFGSVEQQSMQDNFKRARNALSAQFDYMDSKSSDWAKWDDTYAFIQNANSEFVESNLTDQAFSNLALSVMVFVNSSDEIVYAKAFDLQNQQAVPLPEA